MCVIKHGYSIKVRIKVETCWGLRIESIFLFLEHGSHSQNPTSRSLPSFEIGHVPQTLAWNTVKSQDLAAWQHLSTFRQYYDCLKKRGCEYITYYSIIRVIVVSLGHWRPGRCKVQNVDCDIMADVLRCCFHQNSLLLLCLKWDICHWTVLIIIEAECCSKPCRKQTCLEHEWFLGYVDIIPRVWMS
jgi:hypothetical protein